MVPAIGSRANAKIVTTRSAGLALTLASKAGHGLAPPGHPPGWRGGRACRTPGGRGDQTSEHVVWAGRCPAVSGHPCLPGVPNRPTASTAVSQARDRHLPQVYAGLAVRLLPATGYQEP